MQRLRKAAQQTIASSIRKTTNGLRLATDRVIANINDWWPQLVAVVVTGGISALLVFIVPQQSWLPEARESRVLLGSFLGAQAAIAALTLAVTLFVMQGISNRQDADDRIYREYVKRSKVKGIFREQPFGSSYNGSDTPDPPSFERKRVGPKRLTSIAESRHRGVCRVHSET